MYISEKEFLSTYIDKKSGKKAAKKLKFPIKLNTYIAKLVSYVTFDGHLSGDFGQIFLSSKDLDFLDKFKNMLRDKFNMNGKFEECRDGFGLSYKYRIFNRNLCRILFLAGAPKGNKSKVKFDVPYWISEVKEFSREYLRIAFDCEGTVTRDKSGYPRMRIGIVKDGELVEDGIKLMESMKKMLSGFGIETTKIWTKKGSNISDGIGIVFAIKTKSFKEFGKHINFSTQKKYNRLKIILESTRYGTGQA